MKNGVVSVILPVYNGERYISSSIKSILNQSYSNIELIIVNDCSTDNTLKIVSEFALKDNRIKIINNPINKKLPASLNIGFKQACGEYYTWTSDDNIFNTNAIQVMVEELTNNPYLTMVYSDYSIIDSSGKIIGCAKNPPSEELVCGNTCGACFLYTSEIAQRVGEYDEKAFLAEDYDYWIRIFQKGKIKHIQNNLYQYRLHNASLTETKRERIAQQTYKVLINHFEFLYGLAQKKKLATKMCDSIIKLTGANTKKIKCLYVRMTITHRVYICFQLFIHRIKSSSIYNLLRKLKRIILHK